MKREINAAVVNVSGRQRMLSQRIALFSLQLVCCESPKSREELRQYLLHDIEFMEKSHQALIHGDAQMNLPGNPSKTIWSMYFEMPVNLNEKVCEYIYHAGKITTAKDAELTLENTHLKFVLNAASYPLLAALDAVVTQYQKENEAQQQMIDYQLIELYKQSCKATEISQQRADQLEQALGEMQQMQTQLIQSEKMSSLGEMLAGVAHEINNPVSFISGNLNHADNYVKDVLELVNLYRQTHPNPSPEIEEFIEEIELDFLLEDLPKVIKSMKIGADRIREIVLSLRNFSRTDTLEKTVFDIHEGIENTLLILQNRLKPKPGYPEIIVIKEFGKLPPVECCAGQINQVFMNLICNALDALEECQENNNCSSQPPTIILHTEMLNPDFVTVRIADNGPGMTEEVKAHLFESFFTTKAVGKGTGLGLSICHQIVVEKHGGSLKCVSSPGKGAEFCIELPVKQKQQTPAYKLQLNSDISEPVGAGERD